MVQHGLSNMLGLDFQLDQRRLRTQEFCARRHYLQEFQKSQSQRHESFAQLFMRSLQSGGDTSPEAEKELEQVNMMSIFSRPARPTAFT